MRDGAPDYTAETLARKYSELAAYQARCAAIDPSQWPIAQQVDYQLVRAEMNGLDFDLRVLKPWARDPAFYHSLRTEQSDTPSARGTQPLRAHRAVELYVFRSRTPRSSAWPGSWRSFRRSWRRRAAT